MRVALMARARCFRGDVLSWSYELASLADSSVSTALLCLAVGHPSRCPRGHSAHPSRLANALNTLPLRPGSATDTEKHHPRVYDGFAYVFCSHDVEGCLCAARSLARSQIGATRSRQSNKTVWRGEYACHRRCIARSRAWRADPTSAAELPPEHRTRPINQLTIAIARNMRERSDQRWHWGVTEKSTSSSTAL